MKYLNTIVLIAVSWFAWGVVSADTMEIVATADARVMSAGINGQTFYGDEATITTSMSGGSNISDGLYEFDLSGVPDGATITAATLHLRTAAIVTNTQTEAPVEFFGFTGDGELELSDQAFSATTVALEILETPIAANTDLGIDMTNLVPLNTVLSDASKDDFFTVRSETENFVLLRVDSLESIDADAVPATLEVTFTGGTLLGDVNMDCNVDLLDVSAFVAVLQSGGFQANADINGDGNVDLLDVGPFVDLLTP